jgi:thiamine-phosphate pyrophosphorylase
VEKLADTGIAHVAIGGITLHNVEDVLRAGAKAVAVCSAITQARDPAAACRALKEKISAFNPPKNGTDAADTQKTPP